MDEPDSKRMRSTEGGDASLPSNPAPGARKFKIKKKVYPSTSQYPTVDFNALLESEKERIEHESSALVSMRGKGSGHEESIKEMLHVLIEADSEDQAHKAERMVRDVLNDPNRLPPPVQTALVVRQSIFGPSTRPFNSQNRAGEFVKEVRVLESVAGGIIGKAGETVKRMQAETGTRIHINRDSDDVSTTMRVITIRGPTQESVDACEKMIQDFASVRNSSKERMNGPSSSVVVASAAPSSSSSDQDHHAPPSSEPSSYNQQQQQVVDYHGVPNHRAGAIIGRQGVTIKSLQQRFRVRITVPPQPDASNPNMRMIEIKGDSPQAISAVKQEIDAIIEGKTAPLGNPDDVSVPVKIPDEKAGLVIGKQGATIKSIQDRMQVRVQIPAQADDFSLGPNAGMRTAMVVGRRDMVTLAVREIEAIVSGELYAGAVAQAGQQQQHHQHQAYSGHASTTAAEAELAKQWEEYYKQLAMLPPDQQKLALEALAQHQKSMGM